MIIQTKIYASFKTTFIKVMGKTALKSNIGTNWLHWIWTGDYTKYFINTKLPDFDHYATVMQENVLALRKYILKYLEVKGYDVHNFKNRSGKISIETTGKS